MTSKICRLKHNLKVVVATAAAVVVVLLFGGGGGGGGGGGDKGSGCVTIPNIDLNMPFVDNSVTAFIHSQRCGASVGDG